ncbi:MAG: hypothetical protein LCI02_09665 [Proteobacteria bacterium]|nr:hypothetical protein [Pseudomonadota bacterium]
MLERLRTLWRRISPHHRRIAAKRRLEAVLHEHGISRTRAARIASHYLKKDAPHA